MLLILTLVLGMGLRIALAGQLGSGGSKVLEQASIYPKILNFQIPS